MKFIIKKYSNLPQKKIFQISTDVKNFHNVMPDYFKSLNVISETQNEKIVLEKIFFLGLTLNVKTKHVIKAPNIHEVYILSGPTKGTVFVESYTQNNNKTMILINVKLKIPRFLSVFGFLEEFVAKKMSQVTDEFISASEKYASTQLSSNC